MADSRSATALKHAQLSTALGEYYWLIEKYSDAVRHLPTFMELYDLALKEWESMHLLIPPRGEEQKRKEYLSFCDGMCKGTPNTPLQCVLAVFGAWAAIQGLLAHDMWDLRDSAHGAISKAANEHMMNLLTASKLRAASTSAHNSLSFHPNNSNQSARAEFDLVGKRIQYQDASGTIKECTIVDFGTSTRKGDWFSVVHADDTEEQEITRSAMDDILQHQVYSSSSGGSGNKLDI